MPEKAEMITMRLKGRSYQYIADKSGVSRQRIQQILSPSVVLRNRVIEKYSGRCIQCGIYVGSSGHIHHEGANGEGEYDDIGNLRLLCIACHGRKRAKPPKFQCLYCKKPIRTRLFCNRECLRKYHTVTFICSWCGKTYSLSASQGRARLKRNSSGLLYCSKRCYGGWFGNNHGFGRHPNHRGGHGHGMPHQWDYEKVYQAQDETGFGGTRLSRLLGIPESTCYDILSKRSNGG